VKYARQARGCQNWGELILLESRVLQRRQRRQRSGGHFASHGLKRGYADLTILNLEPLFCATAVVNSGRKPLYALDEHSGGDFMINRQDVLDVLSQYDKNNITVGVLGSHSALDVCDGARDEGLPNIVVCQQGRDGLYTNYFRCRTVNGLKKGIVDETIVLNKFDEILGDAVQ
jgi:hypothetical protein